MSISLILKRLIVKSFIEPLISLARLSHSRRFSEIKIKLVAVAKNEASYLSEWVLHHLYFGVSEIEIHYNQCDDNTVEVGEHLAKKYPVKLIKADPIFASKIRSPQVYIYRSALKQAEKEGFSHVLFLDIDEFLTPKDLNKSIPDMLKEKSPYDVVAANWCNKLDDIEEYGRAIEAKISVEVSPTVKTITKTFVRPRTMNPHIVISEKLHYGMTGDAKFVSERKDLSKVIDHETMFQRAEFFVLHRQYRSQREYIALLGRGRPIEDAKKVSMFKNNRRGYNVSSTRCQLTFDIDAYEAYSRYLDSALSDEKLSALITKAQLMVIQRYEKVVSMIENAPQQENALLKRLLKNIDLADVVKAQQNK